MNQESIDWFEDLPRRIQQYSIVFVQCGWVASEVRSLIEDLPGIHISAEKFSTEGTLAVKEAPAENMVYLYDLESLRRRHGERLGPLRDRVMRAADGGKSFALISSMPKTAYPDTRGSDVIADAKQLFLPAPLSTPDAHSQSPIDKQRLDMSHRVRELGDRTIIALSEVLWESQLDPRSALGSLSRPDVEALRGAGFVHADGRSTSWIDTGQSYKLFRVTVGLVCSESSIPNEWVPDSFSEVWSLERTLRNIIRTELIARMGEGWRETCLPEHLRKDVLERACRDSHPSARKLGDLRDPLEWLTTSELLDLRETRGLGGLGLEPFLWLKLRNEIVPIRNKIAHMRLVSEQDAQRAAMWRKLIASKTTAV